MLEKLVVVDTETGGVDPSTHSILSIGAVIWESGELIDSFHVLIAEPQIIATEEARSINRIDPADLKEIGLAPAHATSLLDSFLLKHFPIESWGEIKIAGHNVGFDVAFVRRLYRLAGNERIPFSHRVLDVSSIVSFLILAGRLPLEDAKFEECLDYFDLHPGPALHTALGDATATAKMLTRLVESMRMDSVSSSASST